MSAETKAARAYARAAFEVAKARGELARWSEMLGLLSAIAEDEAMRRQIASPIMGRDKLTGLVLDIARGRLSPEAENLVRLLGENGRLGLLSLIAREFEDLRREDEGRLEVRVVSAKPLDAAAQARLDEALARRFGKRISLSNEIDESLIGGAIVYAEDQVIDGSMRGRLQGLAQAVVR